MHGELPIEFGTQEAAEIWRRRLESGSRRVISLQRMDRRLVRVRTALFLMTIVCGVWFFGERSSGAIAFGISAFALLTAIAVHRPVLHRLRHAVRVRQWYSSCLQRLTTRWTELPLDGAEFRQDDHAWSQDLDLFGRGSLFQKLNQCRIRPAQRLLARWMTEVPSADEVRRRQAQAESLRHELDLRERLAVIDDADDWEATERTLSEWAAEPPSPVPAWIVIFSGLLGTVGAAMLLLVAAGLLPVSILLLILLVQLPLMFLVRSQIRKVVFAVDRVNSAFRQLSHVVAELETHEFTSPLVQEIQQQLSTGDDRASEQIRLLSRRIEWLNNAVRNQLLAPFAWLCGLVVLLTHRIECWRQAHGPSLPQWIDTAAELEVLLSIGAWSFDHSDATLPEIEDGAPVLSAEKLGHPLLPNQVCVRNDVHLSRDRPLMMISGSNMSGKSTLLRSIGTNLVLAWCGARVSARKFRTVPFQLGTVMRVSDSLMAGRSLFFSVVERLRQVVDLTSGPRPVLFLLDEILHGTNSNDRRRGAEAVIRTLINQGALGLVTTHDLELTRIVDSLDGRAANFHFQDQIADGHMTFDYRLRDGVVQRSNAIELMRMMGLDV